MNEGLAALLAALFALLGGNSILPPRYQEMGCQAAKIAAVLACGAENVCDPVAGVRGIEEVECDPRVRLIDKRGRTREIRIEPRDFTLQPTDRTRHTRVQVTGGDNFTVPYRLDQVEGLIQEAEARCE